MKTAVEARDSTYSHANMSLKFCPGSPTPEREDTLTPALFRMVSISGQQNGRRLATWTRPRPD